METCKLHTHTVERMDQFFADTAVALRKADVLDVRVSETRDAMTKHEARIANLEKLVSTSEGIMQSTITSVAVINKELDKLAKSLSNTNKRFIEMEKHVVLLTFKVGVAMSIVGGALVWAVQRFAG